MRILAYIILSLVISGCVYSGSQTGRRLDESAQLLHTDPEAALKHLNAYNVAEFDDSATMARWALLYSEALVVNKLAAPTDTIVNIAVDYYGRHNLDTEYRRASQLKLLLMNSGTRNELAEALYVQKEKELLIYKERIKRQIYLAVGLVVILISAGIIIWLRQRIKLQSAQNDALMAEASGLKCIINADRGKVDRLEDKLHRLLENRFALIDSLCQTYYEAHDTKTERKAIVDKVKSEIESVRNDSFSDMENAVNDCRDNLLEKVRELYPDIKLPEYQLLVYLACRLSTRTISLLIGESVDVVYKRKSRLKSRLNALVAPNCPEISDIF